MAAVEEQRPTLPLTRMNDYVIIAILAGAVAFIWWYIDSAENTLSDQMIQQLGLDTDSNSWL